MRTLSLMLVWSCLLLAAGCNRQSTAVPDSPSNGGEQPQAQQPEALRPKLDPRRLTHLVTKAAVLAVYDPPSRSYVNVSLPAGTKVGVAQNLGSVAYVTTQDGQSGELPANILWEVWRLDLPDDVAAVSAANNQFACNLYGELRGGEGNLFFSPLSIHAALAMTWAGASGPNEAEMAKTLRFSLPQERVHAAYGQLQQGLKHDEQLSGFSLSVANRLWGQQNYRFVPAFLDTTRTHYGAELGAVDFGQPDQAAATINAWVQKQTRDKIKDLISPEAIDPHYMRLILTNAVYFQAEWTEPFKVERTKSGPFHLLSGETIEVPLMSKWEHFRFLRCDGFKLLELPYGQGQLSMLVLLPDANDGLAALEVQLTAENISRWHAEMRRELVEVAVPRFTLESRFSLKATLKQLGIVRALERQDDNFLGITKETPQWLTEVLHKEYVDVNEQGTEAAAATAVMAAMGGVPPPPPKFIADHPFVFLIRDNLSGAILFFGRVVDPREA